MTIAGTLRTMAVADVVQWLATSRKSGTLVVEGPRSTKKLFFRLGNLVAVASDQPREMLGYYLIGWGYLDEDELEYFIAMQEHFRVMLGELLVKLGHLSRKELDRVLRVKTEETLFDLLHWEEGSFRFLDGELPERDFLEVELPVASLLLEGFRQRDERRRMQGKVGGVDMVPRLEASFDDAPEDRRTFAAAVDGRRSIAGVALACRRPEFEVLAFVFDGVEEGSVSVHPPLEAEGRIPGAGATPWLELVSEVEESLERGRLLDALRALLDIEERFGASAEVGGLVPELRRRLEEELDRGPLGRSAVLEPAITADKLIRLDCEPAEGFVLSRITGHYTVDEVLQQLPGARLVNRVLLHNLLRRGLIKLRASTGVRRYRHWSPVPAGADPGDEE